MAERRRVAVVSTTRAEFHILEPLLNALEADPRFSLQLIVSGTHLSQRHGLTVEAVRERFPELVEVDAQFDSSDPTALVRSCGLLAAGVADQLRRNYADVLVVLGDRFELLSVAQSAILLGIPIAHLHGGETTAGAIDDLVRNALTQLASLHLVATEDFAQRVFAIGAELGSVYVVGALGVEAALNNRSDSRSDALQATGLADHPYVVVALHPETRGSNTIHDLFESVRGALEHFPDLGVVVTRPNADVGGDYLAESLKRWALDRPRACFVDSLGDDFATVVSHAEAIIGNSSSGVIEAPALRTPTVNIGERQRGRPCASSVLSVAAEVDAVSAAIETALTVPISYNEIPYRGERAAKDTLEALASFQRRG